MLNIELAAVESILLQNTLQSGVYVANELYLLAAVPHHYFISASSL